MKRKTAFGGKISEIAFKCKRAVQHDIILCLLYYEDKFNSHLQYLLKKYKAIKFQLHLQVVLSKIATFNNIHKTISIYPWFVSEMKTVLIANNIIKLYRQAARTVSGYFETFLELGSGWTLNKIQVIKLTSTKYQPLVGGGCSSLKLPSNIGSRYSVLTFNRCRDDKCFLYAIAAILYPQNTRRSMTSKYDDFIKHFNTTGLEYPTPVSQIKLFEKNNNNISISVFSISQNTPFPLYVSARPTRENHVNLLLYNNHYYPIIRLATFLSKFFYKWRKMRYYCEYCLCSFLKRDNFLDHSRYCGKSCQIPCMPEADTYLKFENFKNQKKNDFVIYMDIESQLTPLSLNARCKTKQSVKESRHTPIAFAALRVSHVKKFSSSKVYTYVGSHVIAKIVEYLYNQRAYIAHIYENERTAMQLTDQQEVECHKQLFCKVCHKKFDRNKKIFAYRDHDHLTGEFRAVLCNTCNLSYFSIRMDRLKIPVIFHNLTNYDGHLILSELHKHIRCKLNIIPRNTERCLAFSFSGFQFIDSLNFMNDSLENLAKILYDTADDNLYKLTKYYNKSLDPGILPMLFRKGFFPYEYIDSIERLLETSLPAKEKFYNSLKRQEISEKDYAFAQGIWRDFKCRTLSDYMIHYLKTDTLLLADVFEYFRSMCLQGYELDPVYYVSAPHLSFDAMLKMTKIELELLTDVEMYNFLDHNIRGGICVVSNRHITANNYYLPSFDPEKPISYLLYLDANSLYASAMAECLPYKGFRWLTANEIDNLDITNLQPNEKHGYIFEVDLIYPAYLHSKHSDYPLAAEKLRVSEKDISAYSRDLREKLGKSIKSKSEKLIPNLKNKNHYVLHYRCLQFYLKEGMILSKIHRVLTFEQKPWLFTYISFNIEKRASSSLKFNQMFYKLMNNAIFGKSLENPRKRRKFHLVSNEKSALRYISKPHFKNVIIFNENLVGISMLQPKVKLNKPIYVGFCTLEISKLFMYKFHYEHIKKTFRENVTLAYTDTDSFIYQFSNVSNIYEYILKHLDLYDTSNYPHDHICFSEKNKNQLGRFKDELGGNILVSFIGLRAKMYALKCVDDKDLKRAKGVPFSVLSSLTYEDYLSCLEKPHEIMGEFKSIRSYKHSVFGVNISKILLSPFDDKRYILPDGINTLPYGHYEIAQ
jgi:hypothetical protein